MGLSRVRNFCIQLGIGLLSTTLLSLWSPAQADSYSTVGVTAKLTYSSVDLRAKRMGRMRGKLRVRDDLKFSRLELGCGNIPSGSSTSGWEERVSEPVAGLSWMGMLSLSWCSR